VNQQLRLEADDADVLRRTALALHDAKAIPDPPLQIRCRQCQVPLARVGDTPHGTLFTSSWLINPPGDVVIVGDRELPYKTATKWIEAHAEVYREGTPMRDPVQQRLVRALISPGLSDYPDLLVRCEKHGYEVLDRNDVLRWLRQAVALPPKKRRAVPIALTPGEPSYRAPRDIPGEPTGETTHQREERHFNSKVMTVGEYERLRDGLDSGRSDQSPGAP
jgi:hypothetical protein